MGKFSSTLYYLIQQVADAFKDSFLGQPASGTTSTALCNTLLQNTANYFAGFNIHFYLGTHKDITREVTASSLTNYVTSMTFYSAVTANVDTTDYFQLTKKFTYKQYQNAVNRAIDIGKDTYLLDKVDDTVTLVSGTQNYAMPTGFLYIDDIILENEAASNDFYPSARIDEHYYRILPKTTPEVEFDYDNWSVGAGNAGKKLRIIGQSVQSQLTTDAATCALKPEFVIAQAISILAGTEMELFDMGRYWQQVADKERKLMSIRPRGVPVFEI